MDKPLPPPQAQPELQPELQPMTAPLAAPVAASPANDPANDPASKADDPRLAAALALFDDYNRRDPTLVEHQVESLPQNQVESQPPHQVDSKSLPGPHPQPHPQEWLHARFLDAWITRLAPQASEALRLAARCQHIGRWEIPRSRFPEGLAGYVQWRTALMHHHVEVASRLLTTAGYGPEMVDAVARIVRKDGLKRDPEVQCMENALCLVFLEHQYDDFCQRYPDKVVEVLRKTWQKMDDAGRAAAGSLALSARGQEYLKKALAEA